MEARSGARAPIPAFPQRGKEPIAPGMTRLLRLLFLIRFDKGDEQ